MSNQVEETVGYNTTAKAYPNWKSYVMSSHGFSNNYTRSNGQQLKRARLYSAKASEALGPPGPDGPAVVMDPSTGQSTGATEIVTTLFKEFQFNPPELQMSIHMAPTDGFDTITPGGNAQAGSTVGMASTAVEMLFDRTQETHAGQQQGSRFDEYGRLGVAKDILDVYAVVKGDREMLEAGADRKSLSALTQELTDLVVTGSQVTMGHRVALQYSRDFILFGIVQSMSFRFVKFNHMLVPTMGYVSLNMDIHNAGNTSVVRNQMAPPPLPQSATGNRGSNSATSPSSSSSQGWGVNPTPLNQYGIPAL